VHGQVRELLSNYGPISVIWFDGLGGSAIDWDAERLFPIIRRLQPNILINNRCGLPGDFDTPEQTVGSFQIFRAWESCMTISAHNQWAWGGTNDGVKSLATCLSLLVNCAGGDGNMLLNVGPRPDGIIDPEQANRLRDIGAWLAQYGESIYGTRGGPWKPRRSLVSTRKDSVIYLHILSGSSNLIELPDISRKVANATLLNGNKLDFAQKDEKLRLSVPIDQRQPIDTIVKLQLEGSAMELPALQIPLDFRAEASNIYHNLTNDYGPQMAFDGDPSTRWATDNGTKQAWVAVALNSPRTVRNVKIREAYDRVRKFEFQCRDGAGWKTIFRGTRLGSDFHHEFAPVTGREFRLRVLDATDGPTIDEIELQ
jgi:alpha-L-fucosidase